MSKQPDLTFAEASEAIHAICRGIGESAYTTAFLDGSKMRAILRPLGWHDKREVPASGNTFRELVDNLRAAWAEASDSHEAQTVREMALEIIRITADLGACTDAALRQKFPAQDVTRYSERACEEANDIAGRGPFSIVTMGGSNAEAA